MRAEDIILTRGQKAKIWLFIVRDIFKKAFNTIAENWNVVLPAIAGFYWVWTGMTDKEGNLEHWVARLAFGSVFFLLGALVGLLLELILTSVAKFLNEYFSEQLAVYEAEEKQKTIDEGVDKVILDE